MVTYNIPTARDKLTITQARHKVPEGLAGEPSAGGQSNYIIGGSYYESGRGFASAAAVQAWADAGFLVASLQVKQFTTPTYPTGI